MGDEQLRKKVREGMNGFARAFNLPEAALLDNVDYFLNLFHGEAVNERLSSEPLQD